jgi:outer membrane protein
MQGAKLTHLLTDRRPRRRFFATAVAVLALAAAIGLPASTDARAESLRQAMANAYKNNPRLDAERARLRATDEEVPRALSGYRPTVNGTADIAYQKSQTKPASGGDGEVHPHGYALNASQPIFRGFRTVNQVREAEATVRAGRETLRSTEQSVLLEAVTAFSDVVRDQAIVRLRENNVNVLSRELRATEDRFKVGEVTRTDVAQATARRAGAVSALDLARANLKTSRATYERVVGTPPSNLIEPSPPFKFLPKTVAEASSISIRENPVVVAALYREQASRHTVDRIWGELLPEVRVDATYTKRYDSSRVVDESETTSVVGRLAVPIYQGGEVHARVRQAKHTHVSRLQEIEQARTETQATAVAAFSRLEASKAQLISDQAQVDANSTALTGVREEEKVGQRTLLDVLNAEQEFLNSQVQLATTKRDVIVNSYNLLSAIGRLNAQELTLASNVYDAEAHYHEIRRKWWGVNITHRDGRHEFLDLWHSHGEKQKPMK